MRKLMNIFAAALIMLYAVGCEKNESLPDDNKQDGKITLTAVIGNSGTKTSLGTLENGEYPVLWSEGDAIAVVNNNQIFTFTLKEGEGGKTKGIFELADGAAESFDPQKEIKAFYPDIVDYNGTAIICDVPQQQTFVAGSFGNGAMPMAAYRAEGSTTALSFDNLFGVLKLQLKGAAGETVTSIAVTSDKVLNGAANVSIGASDNSITLSASDDENKTVTLHCGTDGKLLSTENITEFLIALPANVASEKHSLEITVNTKLGNAEKSYTLNTEQAISEGMIKKMPVIDFSIAYIENGVYYGDGIALPKSADGAETLIWAPVNCGYDENHKYGLLYQWGRKDGSGYDDGSTFIETNVQRYSDQNNPVAYQWDGTSEISPDANTLYFDTDDDWISSRNDNLWYSTTNKAQYDPCPVGWRVPTNAELITLVTGLTQDNSVSGFSSHCETINDTEDKYYGMSGFWFYGNTAETTGNKVFFPAAGILSPGRGGEFQLRHEVGYYWSSSIYSSEAWYLSFLVAEDLGNRGTVSSNSAVRAYGRSVRCVKE
ncbi:MAG: hypothetical protein IJE52_04135 [Bacteroidales bacterium]|nr:hypothetical protein [Bacteroidales bacterium]